MECVVNLANLFAGALDDPHQEADALAAIKQVPPLGELLLVMICRIFTKNDIVTFYERCLWDYPLR